MSGPTRPDDRSIPSVAVDQYVIVKFRAGLNESLLRRLYERPFNTADQHPDELIPNLPDLLNWRDVFDAARGAERLSVSPLSGDIGWDQLQELDRQGRAFTQMASDQRLELDREGRHVSQSDNNGYIPPELETFFRFDLNLGEGATDDDLQDALKRLIEAIAANDTVEMAYIAREPGSPPRSRTAYLNPATATHPQGYFGLKADGGMGIAAFFDKHPKADGRDVNLIDVEQGWYAKHPDLPKKFQSEAPFTGDNIAIKNDYPNAAYAHGAGLHGLMVLGLLVARHDGQGVNGIAPGTKSVKLASEWRYDPLQLKYVGNTYSAIDKAAIDLRAGDVLLIEGQQEPPELMVDGNLRSGLRVPVETRPDLFKAILAATQKGVTVIEPLGNNVTGGLPAGISLDDITITVKGKTYRLFSLDSGSILVAAGSNPANAKIFDRAGSSNYSKYTNCFADGDWLWVLDPPAFNRPVGNPLTPAQITDLFAWIQSGGTSSASAIVAGVAVLLQSLARQRGRIIRPLTLRTILGDRKLNTESRNKAADKMGVMPDLVGLINEYPKLEGVSVKWP